MLVLVLGQPNPPEGPPGPPEGPQPNRGAQVGGPKSGPSGWALTGPKWVGPSWAQVGGPKLGPSQKFGIQKIQKIKILKIKIHVAQNVGEVWIGRKKIPLAPFGVTWALFLRGPEKCKKTAILVNFPWWANGCYSPGLGQWMLNPQEGGRLDAVDGIWPVGPACAVLC